MLVDFSFKLVNESTFQDYSYSENPEKEIELKRYPRSYLVNYIEASRIEQVKNHNDYKLKKTKKYKIRNDQNHKLLKGLLSFLNEHHYRIDSFVIKGKSEKKYFTKTIFMFLETILKCKYKYLEDVFHPSKIDSYTKIKRKISKYFKLHNFSQ